jgi:membrane associated rhomboid family serine protease
MLPIGDNNPTRTTPFVNHVLLVANLLAFALQQWLSEGGGAAWLVPGYGLVPTRFLYDPPGEAFTLFTSMFMHGGIAHLVGNLLFLHIFGDNVEDAMGHFRYLVFYLVCGVAAGLVQVAMGPHSTIPMVGASGAIAGVLGGYMVLYPFAPIKLLNFPPLWFFLGLFIELPAWLVTGLWFLWNLVSGVGRLGTDGGGGVAFFAHVGGFVAGLLLVRAAMSGRTRAPGRWRWSGLRPPAPRPSP